MGFKDTLKKKVMSAKKSFGEYKEIVGLDEKSKQERLNRKMRQLEDQTKLLTKKADLEKARAKLNMAKQSSQPQRNMPSLSGQLFGSANQTTSSMPFKKPKSYWDSSVFKR